MKYLFSLYTIIVLLLVYVQSTPLKFLHSLKNTLSKTSPKCQQGLREYLADLRVDLNSWALQMMDASSKMPSGILSFNVNEMGDFDQCVNIAANTTIGQILGKYCLVTIHFKEDKTSQQSHQNSLFVLTPDQISFLHYMERLAARSPYPLFTCGLCLPHECTASDVQIIGNHFLQSLLGQNFSLEVDDNFCQTIKDVDKQLSFEAIVTIILLTIMLCWVFISTLCDIYYKSKCPTIFQIFSAYTNGQKLIKITKSDQYQISCLEGLKFISMMWVVIGHRYLVLINSVLINPKELVDWANSLYSMFYVSATFAVDTFLTVTGLLTAYVFMNSKQQKKTFNILFYYCHRYTRLTAPLALVLLINATLLTYLGSGPRWPLVELLFQQHCVDYWWTVLLYVQNYVNILQPCIGQTWFLCVDFQLFLISPLILHFLWKCPKACLGVLSLCILGLMGVSFYTAWTLNVTVILSNFYRNMDQKAVATYYETHTRAAPWVMGLITGCVVVLGWLLCFATLFACVLGGHSTLRGPGYDRMWNSVYMALTRPAWSVAICWIVLACSTNNGGPVNSVLSLPIFQVFNRFIYSIYLVHLIVLYMIMLDQKSSEYFSTFKMVYEFWGILAFSTIVAVFLVLAVESPVARLEKILIGKFLSQRNKRNSYDIKN